jgi:Fur family zinc uptake transcriptional regulator
MSSLSSNNLTKNQALVLTALSRSSNPMTAYHILDVLHSDGLRAPPQVYRALDKLIELGLVHRLESLNAFMSCQQPDCLPNTIAFAICDQCDNVREISDSSFALHLKTIAEKTGLKPSKSTIEVHGMCKTCQKID